MNPHFFGDANEVCTFLALLIEVKEIGCFANAKSLAQCYVPTT